MKWTQASICACLVAALSAPVVAQPTPSQAFTYQGQLTDGAAPAAGPVNLLFQLYDDPQAGMLLGSQAISGVVLERGLFTVTLNDQNQFGANAFNGQPRWLAISVDGVLLTPRQPITATPYALKVAGIDGFSLDAADGSPVDSVYVDNTGRVGIGTTSPTRNLHVAGAANPEIRLQDTSGKTFHLGINSDDDSFRLAESGVADRLVISATGNVGINTIAPTMPLSLRAAGLSLISLRNSLDSERWSVRFSGDDLAFVDSGSGLSRMVLRTNGNVGIGTGTPTQRLSVAGIVESISGGFRFPDGTVQTTAAAPGAGAWAVNGANIYNTNTGFVGIGVTDPDAPVTVRGVGTGGYDRIMTMRNASNVQKWEMSIDGFDTLWVASSVDGHLSVKKNGDTSMSGNLTVGGSTTTRILHITGGSDIAEPFNVNSDEATERRNDEEAARCGDETSPRGSGDEARNTLVRGSATEVIPGMVVTIDPDRVGELRISRRAYDSTVAGIISGAGGVNAGLMLTQENSVADGKHPVALTGRVWCWCDADAGGPIRAGDLLTTSQTPGHAMKATDRERAHGAVLGKAMSALESGRGLVLVLVNLQ